MSRGRSRARRCAQIAVCALLAAGLSGCGDLGGGPGRTPSPWTHDAPGDRWFHGEMTDSPELVQEHLPSLGTVSEVLLTDGRFTDPDSRVLLPAPDDYWWQAVVTLDSAEVEELLADVDADAGTIDEEELMAPLVPPIEEAITSCPEGWVEVHPAVTEPGSTNISSAGDLLELVAVCPGGEQLIVAALDM